MNTLSTYDEEFQKVVNIIESAKERAYRRVNEELVSLYRDIGEYISRHSANAVSTHKMILCDDNYTDLINVNTPILFSTPSYVCI